MVCIQIRLDRVGKRHHDHAGELVGAGVVEDKPLLYICCALQTEEGRTLTDRQHGAQMFRTLRNRRRVGLQGWVGEEGLHDRRIGFGRETHAKVVGTAVKEEAVKPVTTVIAVAVERFRAQQVDPGVEEGHPLGQHR